MSSSDAYPAAAPPPAQGSAAKTGCKFGCGMLLGCLGLILLVIVILVISFVNMVNWFKNGIEPSPAVYAEPDLTLRQRAQLTKIHIEHRLAYETGTEWDVEFEPTLFNAFIAEQIQKKKDEGTYVEGEELAGLEILFVGSDTVIRASIPADKGYLNLELRGDPWIERGEFRGKLDEIKLAGEDAPWMVTSFVDAALDQAKKEARRGNGGSGLEAIKLLRREGDDIHIIFEAGQVPPPGGGD